MDNPYYCLSSNYAYTNLEAATKDKKQKDTMDKEIKDIEKNRTHKLDTLLKKHKATNV